MGVEVQEEHYAISTTTIFVVMEIGKLRAYFEIPCYGSAQAALNSVIPAQALFSSADLPAHSQRIAMIRAISNAWNLVTCFITLGNMRNKICFEWLVLSYITWIYYMFTTFI